MALKSIFMTLCVTGQPQSADLPADPPGIKEAARSRAAQLQ
jgi:hypothetical protein